MYTLITAATSSEAYRLKNKLPSENIILGDYLELPGFLIQAGKALQLPDPAQNSYTHQVLALCLDKQIDTIYPLRQPEELALIAARQLFAEYSIQIKAIDNEV